MNKIQKNFKTELIAEIGLSHEGSLGRALSMMTECKNSGMDYVKFQYHCSRQESTKDETFAKYILSLMVMLQHKQ